MNGFLEFFIRKGAHVSVFFLLTIFFYMAIKKTLPVSAQSMVLLAFLLTFMYALMDEFRQSFTPNRTAYIGDVLLDTFGGLLAVMLIMLLKRRRSKRKTETRYQFNEIC